MRGIRARARPLSSSVSMGKREGGRLAGAGLGDAEDVAAREDVRDGLRLNRRRFRVAGRDDRLQHLFA